MKTIWLCWQNCYEFNRVCKVYSEKYQAGIWLSQANSTINNPDSTNLRKELGIGGNDGEENFDIKEVEVI